MATAGERRASLGVEPGEQQDGGEAIERRDAEVDRVLEAAGAPPLPYWSGRDDEAVARARAEWPLLDRVFWLLVESLADEDEETEPRVGVADPESVG